MKVSEKAKALLRTLLPLSLGGLLFWLLYRQTDFGAIKQVMYSDVNYPILLCSLLWGFMANVVRGYRWKLLVDPIVEQGAKPRLINSVLTVLGSYTVNMGIPRAGELWRCAEMKRYESMSFSSLFGTLITDRLMDVFVLLTLLTVVFLSHTGFFVDFFATNDNIRLTLDKLFSSYWLYIAGLVVLGIAIIVGRYIYQRPNTKVYKTIEAILKGLLSIRTMQFRGRFLVYTLLIWFGYFGFFYTTFYAFSFTKGLGLEVGIIAFTMSVMTVVAPVQAGLGPWHFMVITTLVAYGVNRTDAGAFALIVHTVQTLWITFVGLIAIILLPILNRKYRRPIEISTTINPLNTNKH